MWKKFLTFFHKMRLIYILRTVPRCSLYPNHICPKRMGHLCEMTSNISHTKDQNCCICNGCYRSVIIPGMSALAVPIKCQFFLHRQKHGKHMLCYCLSISTIGSGHDCIFFKQSRNPIHIRTCRI